MNPRKSALSWLGGALVLLLSAAGSVYAQSGTVTGQVMDAQTGQPLAGVQVYLSGTNRSSITQDNGRYMIVGAPTGMYTVVAELIGYGTGRQGVTISDGASVTVNFELSAAAVSLDEVIVTVTGEQRARELPNAVGTIQASQVTELAPVTNLAEVIVAQSPGVSILQSSGTVGVGGTIKIRGNASISLDNTPLIYVDGVRINNNNNVGLGVGGQTSSRLNDINPDDIERIEVIKGPAAAALYGTEAGPGVIQIFTKRGRPGAASYTFRLGYGANIEAGIDYPDRVMHPRAVGLPSDTVYRMNLMKEFDPFRTGYFRSFAGSVSGGMDAVTYYISGEYETEDGVFANNSADRYYGRGNFTIRASENVDITLTAGYTSNFYDFPQNDNNTLGYLGNALLGLALWHAMDFTDPSTGETIKACPLEYELARLTDTPLADLVGTECGPTTGFFSNSFEEVATIITKENTERFTGGATMNWRPFPFMQNRFSIGYDQGSIRYATMIPNDPRMPFDNSSLGERNIDYQVSRSLTLEYGGSLSFDLSPDFNSVTSFGVQYSRRTLETAASEGKRFPAGAPTVGNSVIRDGDEEFEEERTIGFYVQEQIGWRDRLFVTPAIRLDDNSAFGQEAELAIYPKLGVSYLISEEDWFPVDFISDLKLRGAWGRSGKQPGVFDALQRYSVVPVSLRDDNVSGAYPLNYGNPDLKPEISEEWEFGFDMGLMDNRIGLELTYFDKTTNDAIVLRDLAPSSGFPASVYTNLSKVYNSGIEVGLNAVAVNRPNLRWDVNATYTAIDNEIGPLKSPIIYGLGGNSQRHQQGMPFGSYFGYKIGIDPETGEATRLTDEPVYLGQPYPKWESALSTSITLFRNVTIFALLDIKGGHQLFNSTEEFACGLLGGGEVGSICPETYERGPDGEFTDMAKMKQYAAALQDISPWIEDADFAKLRTVSVQFNIPSAWVQRFGAARANFTLAGQELATWTDYSGLDPEINFAGQSNASRAEFLTMPRNRRIVGTLSVTF